ncbi:hypothetical protein [Streptomyces sp. NPDC051546]|uniref:hypothetical protein n=1 Tax=Streptomyces sp. NPDC051546 TaxID=3365655 RepID=UPI0037B765EF
MSDSNLPRPPAPELPARDVPGELSRLLTGARRWPLDSDQESKVLAVLDRLDSARLAGRWDEVGRNLDELVTLAPPGANEAVGEPDGSSAKVGERIDRILHESTDPPPSPPPPPPPSAPQRH